MPKAELALIDDVLETLFLVANPTPPEREGRISDENFHILTIGTLAGRLQYIRQRLKLLEVARASLRS